MLTDIFSALDPATNSIINSSLISISFWTLNFIFVFILTSSFWVIPTRIQSIRTLTTSILYYQASRTSGIFIKGFSSILRALFLIIILINLHGLIPYRFRVTRHLIFTLSFGLVLWLSLILSRFVNKPINFLGGLLPGGAPDWLNPFLVLIETTRITVRPITLSFRLAANIRAGHIVLRLIGIYTASALFSRLPLFIILFLTQTGYVLFEIGICLVQAYIFSLLLTLYADDHS